MIIQPINTAITTKGTPALAHAFVRGLACADVRVAGTAGYGDTMGKRMPCRLLGSLGNAGFMSFGGNWANAGVNTESYRYDSGGSA